MNTTIIICVKDRLGSSASCGHGGAEQMAKFLEQELAARGVPIPVKRMLCFGRCNEGPNLRIAPGGAFYTGVTQEMLGAVIDAAQAAHLAENATKG
ncbi:MAG: (2Fe-2S) ferredoxin domain-containing protein [Magnetococcales bacterium]|nr:(2Fe-2S) ferredoxin domain-containing protein [Magnetococcales bacterium]